MITEPAQTVAREEVAAIPYASIGVSVDGSNEFVLILVQSNPGHLLWTSGARIVLGTSSGRIVQTAGLERNLDNSLFALQDWLNQEERTDWTDVEQKRSIDLADMDAYSVAVNCLVTERGNETVVILGTNIQTRRVEEACYAPELDWSFVNQFWLGQTSGFVWKSVQYVHPQLGPIETRIFRPPA